MFPSFRFLLCLVGSLIYFCCCFHGHSMCVFHHYSHVLLLCRVIWSPLFSCPLIFSRPFSFTMFPSFPFLLCLVGSLIYICCCFPGHSMCVFHHYSHVFVLCRVIWSPLFSCPLIFSRPFCFCNVPFLSFSSMSCWLIDLYLLLFPRAFYVCLSPLCHVFVPCGVIWSPLFSCPLTFSRPFLLQCSLPFLFFYVLLAHWSIFAVVSTGILCVSFTTIATCFCSAE